MRFTGYQSTNEIADMLGVSDIWLDEELNEQMSGRQLVLYGEDNWFRDDLQRWFIARHSAITEAQRRAKIATTELFGEIPATVGE